MLLLRCIAGNYIYRQKRANAISIITKREIYESIFSTLLSITHGLFITFNIAVVTDLDTKDMDYVLSDAVELEARLG